MALLLEFAKAIEEMQKRTTAKYFINIY
jgi:hypothetical protein